MKKASDPDSGFDRIAWAYDFLAFLVFGNSIKKAQAAFLSAIPLRAKVLLIGGGSGWLLKELLTRCRPHQVVYVEASGKMMALSRKAIQSLPFASRVEFCQGNETTIVELAYFDVVITPFFLDLFTPHRLENEILPRLFHSLRPQGLWLQIDFTPSSHWAHRWLLRLMYWFFRKVARIEGNRLPNYTKLLLRIGMQQQALATFYKGFVASSFWLKPMNK
jgi:ubiquinone/menaquinone biosynthesis C-methylase UbiE